MPIIFWGIRFLIDISIGLPLLDRSRWREILPVAIFASWLSYIVESIMTFGIQLWSYAGHPLAGLTANGFGIYIIVTYLFIQWLPKQQTPLALFQYFFYWTAFAISYEWVHLYFEQIRYHRWWDLGYSYLADWLLFWIFYKYYHLFHFKKPKSE